MGQLRYVVVCSDGTSHDLSRRAPFAEWGKTKEPRYDLPDLLGQGWTPVRETGMGGGEHFAYALVLLHLNGDEESSAPSGLPDVDLLLQEQLAAGATDLHDQVTALVERHVLSRVMSHTGGNQLRAARILGITRGTLRTKLRALGLADRPGWSETDQADTETGPQEETWSRAPPGRLT